MTAPDEDYGRRERLLLHHSHQYPPPGPTPSPGAGERYIPAPTPPPGDRYIPTSGERYLPSSGERYHQSSSAGDRFLATSGPADRYLSPADRFLPTASSVTSDRYLSPPAPAPSDRFLPPSTPAPGERYMPPPPSATSGGPGDPYMRRDLGYHHHYRLPHPSYHPHHPHHQYHSQYHHQRALPVAPHHRSLNYHAHMAPSPNRNHNRCCPSPSHYGPSADPPYILSSAGSPGNGSAANTPSASGSGSGGTSGVVMLAAVTGSGTVPGTSSSSSASPVTVPSASVSTTREYMTSSSPLLSHRGRTPPCSVVSQRPSVSGNNVASSASNAPVIEYVGASGGRHVSTPTPPPSAILPRCGSLSSCDLGIENPLCSSGDAISSSTGSVGTINHHQHHHQHNHLQQQPPQRRGCSGVLETFDTQGSTVSLCCGNSRRYQIPQQPVNSSVTSAGDMTPCVTTTAPSITRPESRQSLAASAATTPSHPPLQHSTPHHTAVWRAVNPAQQGPTPAGTLQDVAPDATPARSPSGHQSVGVPLERSFSAPASSQHNVGTRAEGQGRPQFSRSQSKSDKFKNLVRKEAAMFFGVEESKDEEEQARWLDRRKRLAARRYGSLKDEYQCPDTQHPLRHQQRTSAYTTQTQDSLAAGMPDVLPGGRESLDVSVGHQATTPQHWAEPPVRRKETVAHMTFGGLAFVVAMLTRHRPRPASTSRQFSRSYPSSTVAPSPGPSSPVTDDEVFFTKPCTTAVPTAAVIAEETALTADHLDHTVEPVAEVATDSGFTHAARPSNWRRHPPEPSDSGPEVGCSRIWSRVLDRVFDNSNRRQYGMGVLGRFFGRSVKHSVTNKKYVKDQLDDIEDHRPFFTYWVTTVQVLILVISLACYGLGPVGLDLSHRSGQVLVTSLSLQQVDYQEPANFWIGPRAGDLIHLGAKFAPCMRKDAKILKEIEKGREKERETACCIRNDDSGCVQSSQADCSKTISTWKKWSAGDSGPGGRISGSVCGLDPKFCEAPASVAPYEWPDDITKWPICRKTNSISQQRFRYKDKMAEHMVCEVIGHPCCIGIHGMCRITTKEYCDFVRGYFHEEASLCSQVSCLDDVCGMIPFYSPEVPDQFYRLWTSLFLHAGIFQLIITVLIQYFLMKDLEKLTGSLRIAIIYMGSGVAGNLASAIFVPYRADVGPAGAQVGLLACLIVEVLKVRPMLKHPNRALLKLIAVTVVLFLCGLLPWVDNYAHLFGFFFGFLLSYALMPYISFGPYDRQKKIALIWVCLLSSLFLFIALVILFYVIPVYDCEVCSFLNCLPITRDFCASQNINFKRQEPVV